LNYSPRFFAHPIQKTETEFAFQLDDPKAAITSFEVCMLSMVVVDLQFLFVGRNRQQKDRWYRETERRCRKRLR